MTEYDIDLDPAQIVHWLRDDLAARRRRKLDIRATREYVATPVTDRMTAEVADDDDVSVLTTVGVLEVRPVEAEHAWVLRLTVEDLVGPHLPDDESVPEDPEPIDLDTFFEEFIAPDNGVAYASLEATTPQAKRSFDRLFSEMITERHGR